MTYSPGITMCIPSIPPRAKLLGRALQTVARQSEPVCAIAIAIDDQHQGAGPTRTRALQMVRTQWTAFMDDDDELLRNHLELLLRAAREHDADVIWPWFKVINGTDPFPHARGVQLDPEKPHIFPITTLVRTELAQLAEFPRDLTGDWGVADWPYWRVLHEAGAKFHHIPDITWHWHHDSGNTSGRPDRW